MFIFFGGIVVLIFSPLSWIHMLKYVMLFMILLIASYFDYRLRIIPDWIHVLILLTGLIDFDASKSLLGVLISPLPFLLVALIQKGSIGGGDIKLVGAIGSNLGCVKTIMLSMSGLVLAILVFFLYRNVQKKDIEKTFLLAPFILCSFLFRILFLKH